MLGEGKIIYTGIYSGLTQTTSVFRAWIENGEFKVKDSQGYKYKIPIDRPDFFQYEYRSS